MRCARQGVCQGLGLLAGVLLCVSGCARQAQWVQVDVQQQLPPADDGSVVIEAKMVDAAGDGVDGRIFGNRGVIHVAVHARGGEFDGMSPMRYGREEGVVFEPTELGSLDAKARFHLTWHPHDDVFKADPPLILRTYHTDSTPWRLGHRETRLSMGKIVYRWVKLDGVDVCYVTLPMLLEKREWGQLVETTAALFKLTLTVSRDDAILSQVEVVEPAK